MFTSQIDKGTYILINLQMEQAYTRIAHYNNQAMSVESKVRQNQGNNISNILMEPALIKVEQYLKEKDILVILDFNNIVKLDGKAEDTLVRIVNVYEQNVIMINFKKLDSREGKKEIFSVQRMNKWKDKIEELQIGDYVAIDKESTYEEHFKNEILALYTPSETNSLSVNENRVMYTNYINVKKIVTDNGLLFKSAFLLSLKLNESGWLESKPNSSNHQKPILFFQSLNGVNIATIVSILIDLDVAYIDHLGPINKLHKTNFRNNIRNNTDYIVVADVISLGNEINRAKNIIEYSGGNYKGAITIVNLKSTEGNEKDIIGLIDIDKQIAEKLEYEIKTSLCPCREVCQHGE